MPALKHHSKSFLVSHHALKGLSRLFSKSLTSSPICKNFFYLYKLQFTSLKTKKFKLNRVIRLKNICKMMGPQKLFLFISSKTWSIWQLFDFSMAFFSPKVDSTPNVGLKLKIQSSRVTCSTKPVRHPCRYLTSVPILYSASLLNAVLPECSSWLREP